ncbi:MAG: ribosome-binding factor A [Candidatus Campbellbacteria bacterium]|nr:ribosome-binding factor A [Candidatus Campbellbacteria bacterium]
MTIRQKKVAELIHKLAAEYVSREANSLSMITVTGADISRDLVNAKVFFTVLPEDKEESASEFLERKKYDFREYVRKSTSLKILPKIDFALDLGEKNRQRIEELSKK